MRLRAEFCRTMRTLLTLVLIGVGIPVPSHGSMSQLGGLQTFGTGNYSSNPYDHSVPLGCLRTMASKLEVWG